MSFTRIMRKSRRTGKAKRAVQPLTVGIESVVASDSQRRICRAYDLILRATVRAQRFEEQEHNNLPEAKNVGNNTSTNRTSIKP